MLLFMVILFCFKLTLFGSFAQQSCFTPTNSPGTCIPFKQCTFLTKQLQRFGSNLPNGVADYLRRAQCYAGDSSTIYICCDVKFNNAATTMTSTSTPTVRTTFTSATVPTLRDSDSTRRPLIDAQLNSRGLSILNQLSCGPTPDDKISFGEAADLGEFPWMALLSYAGNVRFQCGGSLITQRYVLTAAHCVFTPVRLIGVRLGEHDLSMEPDCVIKGSPRRQTRVCLPPTEDFGIERIISHESYSESRLVNDIALIKLDRRVVIKKHIAPICLPITQPSQDTRFLQTMKYIIAGWGTTQNTTASNVLMKAKIPHLDNSVCRNTFPYITFTSNHICAGGELRIDTCKGDSGGPLFVPAPYREKKQYVQYGVVSAGVRKCGSTMTYPGVYSSVIDLLPWITANIDE